MKVQLNSLFDLIFNLPVFPASKPLRASARMFTKFIGIIISCNLCN